jgi:hypothetical protein
MFDKEAFVAEMKETVKESVSVVFESNIREKMHDDKEKEDEELEEMGDEDDSDEDEDELEEKKGDSKPKK